MIFLFPHTIVNVRDLPPRKHKGKTGTYIALFKRIGQKSGPRQFRTQCIYKTLKVIRRRRTGRWNKGEIQTISWQVVLDPSQQTLLATKSRRSRQTAVCSHSLAATTALCR